MSRFIAAYFRNRVALLVGAIISILGSVRAEAQEIPCAPTGIIEQQLTDDHGETLRASREAPVAGGVAHLWTNGPTGSYTVLINPEPGMTCVIDMGQSDSLKEREA